MATGRVLAEAEAVYRVLDQSRGLLGAVTHSKGLVEKQTLRLVKLPKKKFQLHLIVPGGPDGVTVQPVSLDDDWDLLPKEVEHITRQVHTLKAPGETRADVALNGAFEGEDVPLFTFELKRKGHFVERLLNPNTAIAEHPEDEPRQLRLGFEDQRVAQEWYALIALCCGMMKADDPSLQQLPMAKSHSKGLLAPEEPEAAALPGAHQE